MLHTHIAQTGQILVANMKKKEIMDYQVKKLSCFYANKGAQMGDAIQRVLSKCEIVMQNKTPLSIEFTPWTISNSRINNNISGCIFWNPVTDIIDIQYSVHYPFGRTGEMAYSRCLKWYLYKWNESRSDALKKIGISFIYPGKDGTDIVLQSKSKVSFNQSEKRIRMSLMQMNDIMESEGDTIVSILSGLLPVKFKREIYGEIFTLLSEMA